MLVTAPIMCVGGIVMAVHQDAGLSWLLLVSVPVLAVSNYWIVSHLLPIFRRLQGLIDGVNRVLREQLCGVRVIRAFAREPVERARFAQSNQALSDAALDAGFDQCCVAMQSPLGSFGSSSRSPGFTQILSARRAFRAICNAVTISPVAGDREGRGLAQGEAQEARPRNTMSDRSMSAISVVDTRLTRAPRFERRTVVILSIMAKLGWAIPVVAGTATRAIATSVTVVVSGMTTTDSVAENRLS